MVQATENDFIFLANCNLSTIEFEQLHYGVWRHTTVIDFPKYSLYFESAICHEQQVAILMSQQ